MIKTLRFLSITVLLVSIYSCYVYTPASPDIEPSTTTTTTIKPEVIDDITINSIRYNYTSMVEVVRETVTVIGDTKNWSGYYDGESGDFYKGSFDDGKSVTIRPYYIGMYHVTQELYEAVMKSKTKYSYGSGADYPVYSVSWYDAIAFCNRLSILTGRSICYRVEGVDWLGLTFDDIPTEDSPSWNAATVDESADGYRLPTEAEWEYAARGGNPALPQWRYAFSGEDICGVGIHCQFGWLAEDSNLSKIAWYDHNANDTTYPVGSKEPNGLGLFDMCGNVWQWCWEWYEDDQSRTVNKCVRGGSFNSNAYQCVVSFRYPHLPYGRYYGGGLRLARNK